MAAALVIAAAISPASGQFLRGNAEHSIWGGDRSGHGWTRSFVFHHDSDGDHSESSEVKTETVQTGYGVREKRTQVRCHDGDCQEVILVSPQEQVEAPRVVLVQDANVGPLSTFNIMVTPLDLVENSDKKSMVQQSILPEMVAEAAGLKGFPAFALQDLLETVFAFSDGAAQRRQAPRLRLRHWAGELDDGPIVVKRWQPMRAKERVVDDSDEQEDQFSLAAAMPEENGVGRFDFVKASTVLLLASVAMAATTAFAIRACRCNSDEARERPLQVLGIPLTESFSAQEEPLAQIAIALPTKAAGKNNAVETSVVQNYLSKLYVRAAALSYKQVVQSYLAGLYDRALLATHRHDCPTGRQH